MNIRLASLGVPFVLLFGALGSISSRGLPLYDVLNRTFFFASLPSLLTIVLMLARKIISDGSVAGRLLRTVEGLADLEKSLYRRAPKAAVTLVIVYAAGLDLLAWRSGGDSPLNAYLFIGLILGMLSAYLT